MRGWSSVLLLAGILCYAKSAPLHEIQNDEGYEMKTESPVTLLIGTSSARAAILQTEANAHADVTIALSTTSTAEWQETCSIAYDCQYYHNFVWSDLRGHAIRTNKIFGIKIEEEEIYSAATPAKAGKEKREPQALAVDWSSQNVYFINWATKQIGVISLNGLYHKYLTYRDSVAQMHALALDLENRHIFFSRSEYRAGRHEEVIGRVDMDGSNLIEFFDLNGSELHVLAVLPTRRELCWLDKTFLHGTFVFKIWCIGLDRSHRRLVYQHQDLAHLRSWTVFNDRFYWTSQTRGKINSVSIHGHGATSFELKGHETEELCGITAKEDACSRNVVMECETNNGGCQKLCLPKTGGGVTCVDCPDNVKAEDGCEEPDSWFFF